MSNQNQIKYRAGQTQTFIATRSFSLGASGITVPEGSELEFDGTAVSYAGLAPTVMPQLRGAIRAGWVVPSDNYDPNAPAQRPQPAGMMMREADGGNPMEPKPRRLVGMSVDEEEREVGNVSQHAAATREGNRTNYRRQRTPREESTAGQRFHGVAVEPQDGVEVPGTRFQTPAGKEARDSSVDITYAGEAISRANKVKVRPGRGRTREELIRDAIDRGGLTAEELAEYQEELESSRAMHGYVEPKVVREMPAPQRNQQREGFDMNLSVGGGIAIADMGGTGQTGETEVVTEEGMTFTRTASPKKPETRVVERAPSPTPSNGEINDALCRKIATAVCKDFPANYVFTDPPRKKIARIQADYDDRPDIIRAVCAAEPDMNVKAALVQEFPEAF